MLAHITDDDYYIDLSGGAGSAPGGGTGNTGEDECQEEGDEAHQEVHAGSDQGPPSHVHVVGGGTWSEVGPSLREGVQVACALRAALAHEFGGALTASVGVATNKLLARLAGQCRPLWAMWGLALQHKLFLFQAYRLWSYHVSCGTSSYLSWDVCGSLVVAIQVFTRAASWLHRAGQQAGRSECAAPLSGGVLHWRHAHQGAQLCCLYRMPASRGSICACLSCMQHDKQAHDIEPGGPSRSMTVLCCVR
jgi:hypothetical protein